MIAYEPSHDQRSDRKNMMKVVYGFKTHYGICKNKIK